MQGSEGLDIESILAPILFTILAFFTRMYKIGQSNIVTWDEAQCVPIESRCRGRDADVNSALESSDPTI